MTTRSKDRPLSPEQEQRAARNTITRYALNADDRLTLLQMVGLEPTPAAVKRPVDARPPRKRYEPKPTTEPDITQLEGRPDLPCLGCGRQMYRQGWPAAWKWGRIAVSGHNQCYSCRRPAKTKTTQGDNS